MSKIEALSVKGIDPESRTLSLRIEGNIGYWNESFEIQDILDNITRNELDIDAVDIDLTTLGGIAIEGLAFYAELRKSDKTITVNSVGYVASAGTILMCGANKTTASPACMFKLHNSGYSNIDRRITKDDLDQMKEDLQNTDSAIIEAYKSKTGRTAEEIIELLDKDIWITAQQAKDFGLIDEIRDEGQQASEDAQRNLLNTRFDARRLSSNKESLLAACADTLNDEDDMKELDRLKAENEKLKNQLETSNQERDTARSELSTAQAKIDSLDSVVTADEMDQKISEAKQQAVEEYKQSEKEIASTKAAISEAGIEAKGETVTEMRRNAIISARQNDSDYIEKVRAYNDEQVAVAFDTVMPVFAKSRSDSQKQENMSNVGKGYVQSNDSDTSTAFKRTSIHDLTQEANNG